MIIVFGSINTDIVVRVPRHVRPGETIAGSDVTEGAGGKGANQAVAARRMGADVAMVGAVGKDNFAATALHHLKADGVDLAGVMAVDAATGLAFIAVDDEGENAIVLAEGANGRARALQLHERLAHGVILVTQNEVPWAETRAAHQAASLVGATVIHNAAPAHVLDRDALAMIDILVVNEHEAGFIAKGLGLAEGDPEAQAEAIAIAAGLKVIVTLGDKGAVLFGDGEPLRVEAPKVDVVDTTGAGDTFVGTFAAALDGEAGLAEALTRAVRAGSLACTRPGAQAAMPRAADIEAAPAR